MKKSNSTAILVLVILLIVSTATVASATFVCPVLGGKAGQHGNSEKQPFVTTGGGFNTVIGPEVIVPVHATNLDGAGSPDGPFASPGDKNYSPIWYQTP